jgi:hypothetical protein
MAGGARAVQTDQADIETAVMTTKAAAGTAVASDLEVQTGLPGRETEAETDRH